MHWGNDFYPRILPCFEKDTFCAALQKPNWCKIQTRVGVFLIRLKKSAFSVDAVVGENTDKIFNLHYNWKKIKFKR